MLWNVKIRRFSQTVQIVRVTTGNNCTPCARVQHIVGRGTAFLHLFRNMGTDDNNNKEKDQTLASPHKKEKSFWRHSLAGGAAGATEACIMYPAEFVKTQLQLMEKSNPKYSGPLNCVSITIKEHGFLGLYRGLPVLLLGSIPKVSVRFTAYEQISKLLKDDKGQLTGFRTLAAGMSAGACEALFAVIPMETIKTKFIHDQQSPIEQRKYKGVISGIATIIKTEGIGGIYKGVVPTILKQSTNQATRFFVYGQLEKRIKGDNPNAHLTFFQNIFSGATAGAVSVFVNNPLDVVKTRMQGLEASNYKGSWDCFKQILLKSPLSFYRGVTPRLVRVCGDAAVTFTAYGYYVRLLDFIEYSMKKS